MDFYEEASLVMVPSGYKDQKVYSSVPDDGSADLTFSRASNATRVNSEGLVEKVRTNYITYSNDFSNAAWAKYGATLTAGQSDPDGGTSATKIALFAGGNYYIGQFNLGDGIKTNSVWLRADSPVEISFNNGQIASVVTLTTSWVRYTITQTGTSSAGIQLDNYAGVTTPQLAVTFYAYQAQNETGDIATDYIPTTSAAVSVGPVSGLPRLNYDAVNPTSASLLLEPQRTNLALYSEQFDNAAWTKTQSSITANNGVSPDGYTNADKLVADTTNNFHSATSAISDTAASWTYSVFAKASGYDRLIMWTASTNFVGFNLTSGAVESTLGLNVTSANIESYGNGWYRCSITSTSTSSGSSISLAVFNAAYTNGNVNPVFTGNGTDGILIYGAQFEAGAYATSYIPTLSSAVTRVADSAYKTGISSLIGQTEGTIFLDFVYNGIQNLYANLINSEKNVTNSFYIHLGLDGIVRAGVFANSVQRELTASGFVVGQRYKLAFAYKTGELAIYSNGVEKATSTATFAFTSSLDDIFLNDTTTYFGYQENVSFNQALLFKTRLSNDDLAIITSL